MSDKLVPNDVFGFVRPSVDVHTLGLSTISKLLNDCGYKAVICDSYVADAVGEISKLDNFYEIKKWIVDNKISRFGFSYRLDPVDAQINFGRLFHSFKTNKLFSESGGPLKSVYFAGLSEACVRITNEYGGLVEVFSGNETPSESLRKLGVAGEKIPKNIIEGSTYDEMRASFGYDVVSREDYKRLQPPDRSGYPHYGTFMDRVVDRIAYSRHNHLPPVIRTHVGPYNSNYVEARKEFNSWLKQLAQTGYLDVVSIGTSQLTQSNFGEEWGNKPNGGGVPVNSFQHYKDIWNAARPMLVRTYAGTKNIPTLAKIHEESLNIAWHALSLWWFCQIDGRGPNTVRQNLDEHYETLRYVAQTGKPYEPNIPHHFAFRGADDVTYVLSALLAAKTAKKLGIRYLILQAMLNTPKYTWGVQDLAKSRALLKLLGEIEDRDFRVLFQPRAGLDYFSPDINTAKCQLAAVAALMDDIEPLNHQSPAMIHVVSYSEAVHLATPEIIDESIKITLHALNRYRRLRQKGAVENMAYHKDAMERAAFLYSEVKDILAMIEKHIKNPYTPEGLYKIFYAGFLPVPYLWECKDEFRHVIKWKTEIVRGSVKIVDDFGQPISAANRALSAVNNI